MIKEAIAQLVERRSLGTEDAEEVMREIMRGEATPSQISAFLIGLRMKGETVQEIAGCARAMRANAIPVRPQRADLVDTAGTGGDRSGTFNISTAAAFVGAAAGLAVAKHGNRAMSSHCGSADLLQALGVKLELSEHQVADCIDEVGMGFLFAPLLHPAMKHAVGPRRDIGVRTIFNVLGPLCNPAGATVQLIGVYSPDLTDLMGGVLSTLGSRSAFVVHGADGIDELSTTGPNRVTRVSGGGVDTFWLDPQELGLPRASLADLQGGSPEENAATIRGIFAGERGPRRDIVVLNAAALLFAAGAARDWQDGMAMATEALDSGGALRKVDQLVAVTQGMAS